MSFLRFATAIFLEKAHSMDEVEASALKSPLSETSKKALAQFKQTVVKAKKNLALSQDFMYIRTRAIGSLEQWGPNQNGDGFPIKELQSSYRSFVGKGNFIDHKSDDITKIRGLVVDAFMNNEDGCVECLIAVDKKSHPQLCRDIETGVVNSVSMGTRVGWSTCSVCGNIAKTENDYCSHISGYKGLKVSMFTNTPEHRYGEWPVHEVNHDLEFIELSWVAVPAFREANVLERIASLKQAVDNNQFSSETKNVAESLIPDNLLKIHEAAQCKDTECNMDIRAKRNDNVKLAAGMLRVKVDVLELTFRKMLKDFKATGKVTVNEKDYDWTAYSSDKKTWHVNLVDDAANQLSAGGVASVQAAVSELLNKNIDTTELIVSRYEGAVKTAYINSKTQDPLMGEYLDDRLADPKKREKTIYDNKDLEITGTDGKSSRDLEQAKFEETAKEGASGALGKDLAKKNETMNAEELEYKKKLSRAYAKFMMSKRG